MGKKGLIIGALIIALIISVILFFGPGSLKINFALENEKIKIGFVAPLSGNSAWFGEFIKSGVELALEDLSAKERANVEVIWEDDKCESTPAITAVQKLIFVDNVKYVIGPLCNEATIPTENLFEENKVISLATGQPNNKIANMGKYHFAYLPEIQYSMKQLAEYAYAKGDRKIAILHIEGDYGFENYSYFKKYFTEFGGSVVSDELTTIDSTDVRAQLTKIKAANPDSILLATHSSNLVSALQQMEIFGLNKLNRYGINAFETPAVIKEVPTLAEGVIYPVPIDAIIPDSVKRYNEKFTKKFGYASTIYSANAYDSFNILYSSIKSCNNNQDCVIEKLSSVKDYPGANGTLNVDERGVGYYNKMTLKTVKDGKFVVLE